MGWKELFLSVLIHEGCELDSISANRLPPHNSGEGEGIVAWIFLRAWRTLLSLNVSSYQQ